MNKYSFRNHLFLFIVLFVVQTSFSQLSKTHYIPPLTAADDNSSIPGDQYFYISTPSATDVSYTIKPQGLSSGFNINGSVNNLNPDIISLDPNGGFGQLFVDPVTTSQVFNSRGYIIEASDLIYVSVRMNSQNGAQAGALVSKGLAALGTEFRIGALTNQAGRTTNNNGSTSENLLSFISVMATEDNTTVTFSDISNNAEIVNSSKTFPYNEILQKGNSYTIAMNSYSATYPTNNKDGLIGALVSSNKPIVVNCGSVNGSFHNGGGRDYGIDQIVGADKIGNEYIFVKGDGSNDWENVLVVAHQNNTEIFVNGNATAIATINAGDYYVIEGNNYSANDNMYLKTSKNVFVYQGIGATSSEANQGMFFVPPLSCETKGNVNNIANIDYIGSTEYTGGVSIVTKKGATVTINNDPLSSFATQGPFDVSGKTEYETYKVTGLSGPTTSIECSDELYCAYFNFNGAATSGSFYSGFPTAPEINFDADFVTLGNCIDNITLEAANMGAFESIEWYYDDGSGSGFIATGNHNQTLKPTFPGDGPFSTGTYYLKGITCTGDEILSDEVPVSICPDDTDNDGIIDNIDIDNDNDGILNCTESYGNQVIDLSNVLGGNLPVGSYSYIVNITPPIGNPSNTITGDANGTITSSVASKNGLAQSSAEYQLNFNKNLNIEVIGNSALTDQDEFIIQVSNQKTITLLDPDDQLLIDTNYDGVYESGITQFSSFEVHFKIKGTTLANGTGTFKFVSSMVDFFSYKHKNSSDTTNSSAAFKIAATCLPIDSDNDGVTNEFDNDSDNDGIPDIVEGNGILKELLINDSNNDGLDDAFDINAIPVDTDNDNVPDYLDLDSDNDGIYDLEESDSGLPDSDFNGIIDNIFSTIGENGLDDNAETDPDSGIINYTIQNTDTDGLFNYIDIDSDGDACFDVFEAGFTDGNNDGFLGNVAPIVNTLGKVTNSSDGYTTPNPNYIIANPITIISPPEDTQTCEFETTIIEIETNTIDSYQWQLSIDNGTTWTNILISDVNYIGSTTNKLTIPNTTFSFNNHKFRVQLNTEGNCTGLLSNEVLLTVNQLPQLNIPATYSQCDDESNDGEAFFNLVSESIKNDIAPNHIAKQLTFFYFEKEIDAKAQIVDLSLAIQNPSNYLNIDNINFIPFTPLEIWIRIENPNNCFSVVPLILEVTPSDINLANYNPAPLIECDNGIDNRDGIASFDLSDLKNYIKNSFFSTVNTSIHFYESMLNCELENDEIIDISNHTNKNSDDIWVRVKSDVGNNCLGIKGFINFLNVEALPFANAVSIDRQCDGNDDGLFPFDTSLIESKVINGQSNVNVSYFDQNGDALPSPLPNPFLSTSQIITIQVANNTTLAPDGPCYDETTLEFIVDKSPVAYPVTVTPVCDDESNDGIYDFDTSTIQATILGSQTGMEVHYFDQLDNELSSPLPNPFSTTSQTVVVKVVNPSNLNCLATSTLDFIVNPLPDFNVITPEIICLTDPVSVKTLSVLQDNPSEVLDYEWTDSNGLTLSTNKTIDVSSAGSYFVTLTKTDGTLCSRTKSILVNPSNIATITQEDIVVEDDSDNNTITIQTNNLGIGDYEFALDNAYGFQDEPFFDYVEAGIHTLFVRDKNNCGTSQIEVSVIGFPKFFTPNNDGFNDTWQVLGLNENLYQNAEIYIFDRFGKLITTIKSNSDGWDGFYYGKELPASDYWFTAKLIDYKGNSRIKKGHFSLIRK